MRLVLRICLSALPVVLFGPLNVLAKCPISPNGTLKLYAPAGNLQVFTTGTDSVEVTVSNRQVIVEERCDTEVTVTAKAPTSIGIADWKITVPRGITLDLTTEAGNIQVADTDGEARLRTAGGKVTAGSIRGNTLIRATEVRTGNIGGNVELRGLGGRLQVGDVAGNAEFHTVGGDIVAGVIKGYVKARLDAGGSVTIKESSGDVVIATEAGDITVTDYVRGSFDGKTNSGNIRIERAGSWVKAFTGVGDIFMRLVPSKIGGDLHVDAAAAFGNITMYVPKAMKATIDAVIEKPPLSGKGIFSDFPLREPINAIKSLLPGGPDRKSTTLNGGGNNIRVRTSNGAINIYSMDGN